MKKRARLVEGTFFFPRLPLGGGAGGPASPPTSLHAATSARRPFCLQPSVHSKGSSPASPSLSSLILAAVAAWPFKLSHDSKLLSLRYERQHSSREHVRAEFALSDIYVLPQSEKSCQQCAACDGRRGAAKR